MKEIRWRRIVISILWFLIKKVEQKARPASERIYLEDSVGPGLYNPSGKAIKFEKW